MPTVRQELIRSNANPSSPLNGEGTGLLIPRASTERDVLALSIFERCIGTTPLVDKTACRRNTALVTSIITAAAAGAAFVPISLHLPAGPAFAVANFIAFFNLDMWAIGQTIEDLFGPKGENEIVLLERASHGKCFTTAAVIASTAIALLSQVPVAIPSLDYDGDLKIPALISLFVGGALIPLRSLQLTIDKTMRMRNALHREEGEKIERLRGSFEELIDKYQELFRKMDRQGQLEHVGRFQQIQGADAEKATGLIEEVIKGPIEIKPVDETSLLSRLSRGFGFWIAGSLQTGLALYTFSKTKEHIIDNDIAAGAMAASVVLSGVYLSGQSIINTAENIARSFVNFIKDKREKSLVEQLRPGLSQSLKLLGGLIDLGALGATIVIRRDFYKDDLLADIYFNITFCLAYFLFLSTATLSMVDGAIGKLIQRTGSDDEKQILEHQNKLEKMKQLIERSSLLDFSIFVGGFSEDIRVKLLNKVDLTTETLNQIVTSQ